MSGAQAVISLNTEDVIPCRTTIFHLSIVPPSASIVSFRCSTGLPEASRNAPTYPPYNIERTGENAYRITLAVAGFAENELSVETRENTLTVRGIQGNWSERRKARPALSGYCCPRLRAPLPARRSRRRNGRSQRERSPAHRPRPRGSRSAEATHHRDQQGRQDPPKRQSAFRPGCVRPSRTELRELRASQPGRPFYLLESRRGNDADFRCVSPVVGRDFALKAPDAARLGRRCGRVSDLGAEAQKPVNFAGFGFERRHQPDQGFAVSRRASGRKRSGAPLVEHRSSGPPSLDYGFRRHDKDFVGLRRPSDAHAWCFCKASSKSTRCGVGAFGQLQPESIREIGLHLRAKESPLGQGLAAALSLEGEIRRARGVEKHDGLARQRAVLGRAEGENVDSSAPGHIGRARLG